MSARLHFQSGGGGGGGTPSGIDGSVQFSESGAFASDVNNFFWDNINKRLGIGTDTPTNLFTINATTTTTLGVEQTSSPLLVVSDVQSPLRVLRTGGQPNMFIGTSSQVPNISPFLASFRTGAYYNIASPTYSGDGAFMFINRGNDWAAATAASQLRTFLSFTVNPNTIRSALSIIPLLSETSTNTDKVCVNNLFIGTAGLFGAIANARLEIIGDGTTNTTKSLFIKNAASTPLLSVLDNSNVGIRTDTPVGKLDVRTTDGFGAAIFFNNDDSSSPIWLKRANNGGVAINTFSSNGTIDIPTDKTSLGYLTRFTGQAYIDTDFRPLARMEYYITSTPTVGNAPTGIRFLTVKGGDATYNLNERLGITDDGNVQIGESLLNNRNSKLLVKGIGTTASTTSLLVQNSAGSDLIRINDLGLLQFGGTTNAFPAFKRVGTGLELKSADDTTIGEPTFTSFNFQVRNLFYGAGALTFGYSGGTTGFRISNVGASSFGVSVTDAPASAQLEVRSTTKGFLPPRMSTVQINDISAPAAGLMAFNVDILHMCVYDGSVWYKLNQSPM